jgi:7-carboxy-7-deazaguanine synthase
MLCDLLREKRMTPLPRADNDQKPELAAYRKDGSLEVVDIWKTIQGEGPDAGTPAVFVRLAGCNLQCPRCDTEYTVGRMFAPAVAVVNRIRELAGDSTRLVVLTGGEPFRQDFTAMFAELPHGYRINIETNGTLWDKFRFAHITGRGDQVKIICSPKYRKVDFQLADEVHSYKYVIAAGHTSEEDGLPTRVLGAKFDVFRDPYVLAQMPERIFVQPEDSGGEEVNAENLRECIRVSEKYGYRVSLQLHKLLGMP